MLLQDLLPDVGCEIARGLRLLRDRGVLPRLRLHEPLLDPAAHPALSGARGGRSWNGAVIRERES